MSFVFDEKIIYPKDPTADKKRIEQYKQYYKVKYDICKEQNPQKIAEIGVRAGYSAWTFLQACPKAKYIGIDANNGKDGGAGGQDGCYMKWTEEILKDYDCSFKIMDTQKQPSLDLTDIDFFHVDGDHSEKGIQHDLDIVLPCMKNGGLILVDDISYISSVGKGVTKWIDKNKEKIKYEYRKSLRGECLIWKI